MAAHRAQKGRDFGLGQNGGRPSRGLHGQLLSEWVQEAPEILSPALDPMTAQLTFCGAKGIPCIFIQYHSDTW